MFQDLLNIMALDTSKLSPGYPQRENSTKL